MDILIFRLGSARAVNRWYISDCVPLKIRMQASAAFVSASALGMACGPALAGLLQTNFKLFNLTFNQVTLPGWVMAVAWLFYLVWLWIAFKEPAREEDDTEETKQNDVMEKGIKQPLLLPSEQNKSSEDKDEDDADGDGDGEIECDGSEEAPEDSRKPAISIVAAYRLLTPSVKVQLLIYFMLKYAMEVLLSESSVVTSLLLWLVHKCGGHFSGMPWLDCASGEYCCGKLHQQHVSGEANLVCI